MGKSLPSAATTKLQQQLGGITAQLTTTPKSTKPISQSRVSLPETARFGGELRRPKLKRKMENNISSSSGEVEKQSQRTPLSRVVSDCVKRWFQDTLKEAKTGDLSMQVLVGQMYYNGYGVAKDAQKGRIWMTRASRVRSSVWKVSNKRPGYNASDSDSDESNGNS